MTITINRSIILAAVIAVAMALGLLALINPLAASAQEVDTFKTELCRGSELTLSNSADCGTANLPGSEKRLNSLITNIVNIISVIIGVIAVLAILYGGFRFITSGGDSGRVSSAKSTVLYALVGLVIVALAQVIVRFVLTQT